MSISRETCQAVILGAGCGDALGAPTEFHHMDSIRRQFGQDGIQELVQTSGRYTDDTAMLIALAEGLLDAHGGAQSWRGYPEAPMTSPDFVMPYVARSFVEWSNSDQTGRAPGNTCLGGCRNMEKGMSWRESGIARSKGCGGIMRVAPVGLVYSDAGDVLKIAQAQCTCTHGHPSAYQAAQLGALAVHLLARRGLPASDLLETLRETLAVMPDPDPTLTDLLWRVRGALDLVHTGKAGPHEVQQHMAGGPKNLGESWHGDEALASSLFCFLLAHEAGEGYIETVRYGANTDGDSDSIATIAGGMAGAYWGLGEKGVPQSWIDQVESADYLLTLADRLHAAAL